MTEENKEYNESHGVVRIKTKGYENAGKMWSESRQDYLIVKYDWSKPFKYTTKPEVI